MVRTKEKRAIDNKKYYQEHKDEIALQQKEYKKKYQQEHKNELAAYGKKYRQEHKKEHEKWYQENKEKIAAHTKKYYQEHKDEIMAYRQNHRDELVMKSKKWHQENKDKVVAYNQDHKEEKAAYYQEHKDETLIRTKKYKQKYPEVHRRSGEKRRLKECQLTQSYTPEQWKEKVDATNGICPQWNRPYKDVHPFCVTMVHVPSINIAPLGFCYTIKDIVPRCGHCNTSNGVHSNGNTTLKNFGL